MQQQRDARNFVPTPQQFGLDITRKGGGRVMFNATRLLLDGQGCTMNEAGLQRLAGHPLYVLESRDDHWHREHGMDQYEGWMHDGYLMRLVDESPVIRTTAEDFALTCVPRVSMGDRAQRVRRRARAASRRLARS